ncbi:serine hydrolase domain-containing protein [Candidatus Odyssella thessalonicensis]|uniref:serine hydrolase domain-containing protein n=1 Tax=Candidatus Odyssella thessalonicensis TaxID=84647 RepID=UPI000225BDBF|nr:serine hydrolase domain-containing protein [Candidatus Odyssella thessalonicensis]
MIKSIAAVITILITGWSTASEQSHNMGWEEVSTVVQAPSYQFNGVLLVKKNEAVLFSLESGSADKEGLTSLTLENKFIAGSITKQMVAALALKQVEEGRLDLHKPITDYGVTASTPGSKAITCHHLLSHRAAFDSKGKLVSDPDQQFSYSNYGYHLVGNVLEKVMNQPLQENLNKLFAEIGMSDTSYYAGDELSSLRAVNGLVPGYMRVYGTNYWLPKQHPFQAVRPFPYLYPASAGVITTVSDLHRWNQALFQGKIVNQASLHLMTTPYSTNDDHYLSGRVGYGYGIQISDTPLGQEFSHAGYVYGYMGLNCYYPEKNLSLIILQNVSEPVLKDNMEWRKYCFRAFLAVRRKLFDALTVK